MCPHVVGESGPKGTELTLEGIEFRVPLEMLFQRSFLSRFEGTLGTTEVLSTEMLFHVVPKVSFVLCDKVALGTLTVLTSSVYPHVSSQKGLVARLIWTLLAFEEGCGCVLDHMLVIDTLIGSFVLTIVAMVFVLASVRRHVRNKAPLLLTHKVTQITTVAVPFCVRQHVVLQIALTVSDERTHVTRPLLLSVY